MRPGRGRTARPIRREFGSMVVAGHDHRGVHERAGARSPSEATMIRSLRPFSLGPAEGPDDFRSLRVCPETSSCLVRMEAFYANFATFEAALCGNLPDRWGNGFRRKQGWALAARPSRGSAQEPVRPGELCEASGRGHS